MRSLNKTATMKKYNGVHGAEYELNESGFDIKVTKPDGKVFYVPLQDMENILRIMEIEAQSEAWNKQDEEIKNELASLYGNKSKVSPIVGGPSDD